MRHHALVPERGANNLAGIRAEAVTPVGFRVVCPLLHHRQAMQTEHRLQRRLAVGTSRCITGQAEGKIAQKCAMAQRVGCVGRFSHNGKDIECHLRATWYLLPDGRKCCFRALGTHFPPVSIVVCNNKYVRARKGTLLKIEGRSIGELASELVPKRILPAVAGPNGLQVFFQSLSVQLLLIDVLGRNCQSQSRQGHK